MKEPIQEKYTAQSLQILEGLEAVRRRPGMYVGSTDQRGLHHLVWEVIDNSIDEVLAGYGKNIKVVVKEDNSILVVDDGRGMPIDLHSSGITGVEVIFSKLHAGGKFGVSGVYKVSGGLHGVGASVVNALSEFLDVTVNRDGLAYHMRFENGGKKVEELHVIGDTKKTGTEVWFKPDPTIFSTTLFNFQILEERIRESAFLIKGLRMQLIDERSKQKESYFYEEGIKAYIDLINQQKTPLHPTAYFEGESGSIEVEVAFQYSNAYSENLISFVNNVRTKDGGTHETGFKSAFTKIFNDHARRLNFLKEKDLPLEGADIREGLTSILSVRIPENKLQFEGQTKNKLGSPEARPSVENVLSEQLDTYLTENTQIASVLIEKALNARNAREASRKAREDARLVKKVAKQETILSGKLSPATSKNPKINELFLVEGDSAGGSAKQGRNRLYQAILPLRGKVINSEKQRMEDVLKNEEISTIISTIGAGLGSDFQVHKSNYNKVIIMTDADTDGAHIQVLLITFFFRYMRPLVEAGKLYIALPPLYKITRTGKKQEVAYAWDDEEREEISKRFKFYEIQRYKGLGEMNASQLWDTTMNPETRTLIRVSIEDMADADQRITLLMGDKVEPRKEWIDTFVSFESEDTFRIKERV
ncbi:MAG: DNA topoisomerase IV subunit B [Candidatus Izemoplasmatales bacterium]|jgi:topoisomerase-4 subunit B|nr:DNA topoisomerase IV subunit B [Candidatus Izemoplasmatales bacterium]MDD4354885.1 DNA topoisomerase IV subunit B [Candidatus Izemoplasmatales bacterium]MDD4987675.1 DNA topoisomerase IV subunit B [Candidatus Izemoplasmatales bacterium]MDD5601356.1 DNA topoisomerase IV subunit B [Candidatus Izemoplasmatales bacterium]NLF49263.1 DNA topoisomerase IV subunit B [Acholeplasmataceae bacterium]